MEGFGEEYGASPDGDRALVPSGPEPVPVSAHSGDDPLRMAANLWALLDDIDTLDDMVRDDDEKFRTCARVIQRRRFEFMSGETWDAIMSKGETE